MKQIHPGGLFGLVKNEVQFGVDPMAKYAELVGIVTDVVGPGKLFPQTDSKMMFTEWQTGQRTIRLYGNSYDVRFSMF